MSEDGAVLRDMGMRKVESNADPKLKSKAKWAIHWVATTYPPDVHWTTDAVLDRLDSEGVTLRDNRLLGPLMKAAEKAGLIEPVVCLTCRRPETALSERPSRHKAPQHLWRAVSE
jgi:hypothetical protein